MCVVNFTVSFSTSTKANPGKSTGIKVFNTLGNQMMFPGEQNWASIDIEEPQGYNYQRFFLSRNQVSEVFLKCLHIKLNVNSTRTLTYSSRMTRCEHVAALIQNDFDKAFRRKSPRV